MPDYVTIPNVELMSVGMNWHGANGDLTFTFEHLADAMEAANDDPLIVSPRVKLGHTDPRFNDVQADHDPFADSTFDGEPAFGQVQNLRLQNDGAVLVGDLVNVPDWLAQAAASAFPSRSIEGAFVDGSWKVTTPGGKTYSFVVTAVSLLGVYLPAVQDLEDLQAVLSTGEGLVVTGAGGPASAGMGDVDPTARADIDKVIDVFCNEFAQGDRYWWWPRSIWTDPNEIIADDDEGALWRVPFSSSEGQEVSFDDPTEVLQTFVDVASGAPAAAMAVADRPGEPERVFAARRESPARAAVTDASWDGSASRFTDEQYARSCILDRAKCGDVSDLSTKQRYSLPVKEPDGTLNRNACHAAAGRISSTQACADAKTAAAKTLVGYYRNQLSEDPPSSLLDQAGMSASAKTGEGGAQVSATTGHMDVDAAKLRKALALKDDASEDEVQAALAAQAEEEPERTEGDSPPAEGDPNEGGETPAGEPEEESGSEEGQTETEPTASDGTVEVDSETWKRVQREARDGAAARSEQLVEARENLLESAVEAGKFPPSRRDHYRELHKADAKGTEELIEKLEPGLVPVSEKGTASEDLGDENQMDAVMASFGIERRKNG